jgi:hypothetical protein
MVSQRKISEFQDFEIETADDSGIMPKAAYELATHQVGRKSKISKIVSYASVHVLYIHDS